MEAYKNSLLYVGLSGPTNCAPMIRHVSRLAIIAAQSRTAQVKLQCCILETCVIWVLRAIYPFLVAHITDLD